LTNQETNTRNIPVTAAATSSVPVQRPDDPDERSGRVVGEQLGLNLGALACRNAVRLALCNIDQERVCDRGHGKTLHSVEVHRRDHDADLQVSVHQAGASGGIERRQAGEHPLRTVTVDDTYAFCDGSSFYLDAHVVVAQRNNGQRQTPCLRLKRQRHREAQSAGNRSVNQYISKQLKQ
jgi:hypothetical protein